MEWVIAVAVAIGCGVVGFVVGIWLRLQVVLRQIARGAERNLTADEQETFIELMDKVLGETE